MPVVYAPEDEHGIRHHHEHEGTEIWLHPDAYHSWIVACEPWSMSPHTAWRGHEGAEHVTCLECVVAGKAREL